MKRNTEIPIHITTHHLTLSPSLDRCVREKLAVLLRAGIDILGAEVVLRRHDGTAHGRSFTASARIAVPWHHLHANAIHANLYAAITVLTNRLSRRLRKRKTAFAKRRNRDFANRSRSGFTSAARLEASLGRRSDRLAPTPARAFL